MKNFYPNGKFLAFRNFIIITCIFCGILSTNGQNYPTQEQLPNVDYQNYQAPATAMPDYLEPFTEGLSGSIVRRIGDRNVFGTSSNRIRHNYSKDQTWNSDETLIKLSGHPAAILDAETYEFLYWANIPGYGRWSHTEPHIMYGSSSNSFQSFDVTTNQRTTLRTFTEYSNIDFGYGEGNQSNDDRYVGLIGTSGSTKTVFVYDIQNDVVTGSMVIPGGDLDWFSVSQSGQYAVLCWRTDGSGPNQGLKTYDINMQNEIHIADTTPHGDLGYDVYGNEVFVGYGDQAQWDAGYSMYMARLDGGGITNLFPYINGRGIWGGHVSCRNIDRPGWAYVSEQCCSSNPVAPREIFAIKLDNSGTIERYAKHHSAPTGYLHETQVVPNRNGTKMIFASNWNDPTQTNQTSAPAFVLEFPQGNVGMTVNAGNDITICEGESTNLTAYGTGGNNFSWDTGESSQNIEVSPNETTTYTVTLSDDTGNSVSDTVTVTVNPLPTANAGEDVTINEGESTTLTASGGTNYSWSTNDNTQSIVVSPTETTTYTVSVIQNGCSTEDTVTVTVIPTPIDADAGQDVTICDNDSVVLTASGGSDYVWSTGETSQSITVSPSETTIYTVTVTEGEQSDSDSVTVTVNPLPTANAGNDITINEGESTTLTASGGDSYEWSTGATSQSITVNPSETTTYTVTVSSNNCSTSDSVTVTVEPSVTVVANAGQDVSICENESIVLTASGGGSYEWSTGETTQSITVSPISTTTYSVTVSEGTVSDSDSVTVTVNSIPTANAGNDITINEGESTTLTASGGNSYEWSTGATSQSITVNPSDTTTYTVTVSSNNCSSSDSVTVTVEPSVTVVANAGQDVSICENESTVLTASGGGSYEWSTGETTQSITVSPNSTTTYSVTVSEGIVSDSDSVTVTVNPIPTANAGSDVTIENGASVTLTASGGSGYVWSNGSTNQSIVVSPNQTSSYSVTVHSNGCSSTDEVWVNVVEPVNASAGSNAEICMGETVTLTASGGLSYEWNTGDMTESITVSPEETSIYTVTVSNGISSEIATVEVMVNNCETNEDVIEEESNLNTGINVYPNPAQSQVNVKMTDFTGVASLQLFDMAGRMLINKAIQPSSQPIINNLNVSNLPRGIYIVSVTQSGKSFTKRLILN
ncbi:T9SS type A sorting domain-containing protein [Hanstruepera ponticola]|uniref:T9SS type A sorting domain-containing protein n=1 Tax=Hanstruepera ponticola TaxID=2042995 RepID=UPI000CF091FB|nr:T9SS type A sorting domain-containing protein [Hanstruepera ponticola]